MLRGLTKPTARPGAGLPASLRGARWMGAAAVAFALRVTLVRGLSQGRYTVHWKITTADGHRQSGRFSFRLVP